jgi:hypothetical protein
MGAPPLPGVLFTVDFAFVSQKNSWLNAAPVPGGFKNMLENEKKKWKNPQAPPICEGPCLGFLTPLFKNTWGNIFNSDKIIELFEKLCD